MAENDDNIKKSVEAKLADLKSRIKDVNSQSAADSLIGEFSSLAIEASGAGIEIDIPNIEASIKAKVNASNVTQAVDKDITAQEQAQQEAEMRKLLQRHEESHQENERLKVQHQQYLQDADKYIEEQQKEIDGLKALNAKFAAGEKVTEEDLNKFIKTPDQIEEERKKRQGLQKHGDESTKHYDEALAIQKEQKQQKVRLEEELKKKRKAVKIPERPTEKEQSEINTAQTRLDQHAESMGKQNKVVEESKTRAEEAQSEIAKINEKDSQKESEFKELRQNIDKTKQTAPEEHQKLSNKLDSLENQENIIKGNPQDRNTEQQAQISANTTPLKKVASLDDLFDAKEKTITPANKGQDNKQQVKTSEKSDISKDTSFTQKAPIANNKQNSTNISSTNGKIMVDLKNQVEKNPKLSLTEELKNEIEKIVKNIRSTVHTIFVPRGVSARINRGPSIGGGKQKDDQIKR